MNGDDLADDMPESVEIPILTEPSNANDVYKTLLHGDDVTIRSEINANAYMLRRLIEYQLTTGQRGLTYTADFRQWHQEQYDAGGDTDA